MIGIITAVAVVTSFEILLLANTQEFSLAFRFYTIRSLVLSKVLISCFSLFNLQGTLRKAELV